MRRASLSLALVLCLSVIEIVAQQPATLPETDKIRDIGVGYSPNGQFSKLVFLGNDGQGHHWLEVWKVRNNDSPNLVNYLIQPHTIITWGRGPVLTELFAPECFPSSVPNFGPKDYWVVGFKNSKLNFVLLDQEEDQKKVAGLFSNLQATATQRRVGGLLDTKGHASMWERNIISQFQKGNRDWIKPEWPQSLTTCIKISN